MLTIMTLIERAKENTGAKSLGKLGLSLQIYPTMVTKWYNGVAYPNQEHLLRLADAANVDRKEALLSLQIERSQSISDEVNLAWRELDLLYRSNKKSLTGST